MAYLLVCLFSSRQFLFIIALGGSGVGVGGRPSSSFFFFWQLNNTPYLLLHNHYIQLRGRGGRLLFMSSTTRTPNNMSKFGLQIPNWRTKVHTIFVFGWYLFITYPTCQRIDLDSQPQNPPLPPHPINQLSGVALAMAYDYSFPPSPLHC